MKHQHINEFKARNPLGAIRTITLNGETVTGKITDYRILTFETLMFGVYSDKHRATYYSVEKREPLK